MSRDVINCAPRIKSVTPHNVPIFDIEERLLLPGSFRNVAVNPLFVVNTLKTFKLYNHSMKAGYSANSTLITYCTLPSIDFLLIPEVGQRRVHCATHT